jgi:hypothetical protein
MTNHEDSARNACAVSGLGRLLSWHEGTWKTGAVLWLFPPAFSLPLFAILSSEHDQSAEGKIICASIAAIGWLFVPFLLAGLKQELRVHERGFVHRKWGKERQVRQEDMAESYGHFVLEDCYRNSLGGRLRTLKVQLASGEELEIQEMTDHAELTHRINELARHAGARQGATAYAAAGSGRSAGSKHSAARGAR